MTDDLPSDTECVVGISYSPMVYCRQPMVGHRDGWRMCQHHFDLFAPEGPQ